MAVDTSWVADAIAVALDNLLDDADGNVAYSASQTDDYTVEIGTHDLDDEVKQKFRVTIIEIKEN